MMHILIIEVRHVLTFKPCKSIKHPLSFVCYANKVSYKSINQISFIRDRKSH